MNCELAHERIVMAEYGELADDAAHELTRHLAICPECAHERETLHALKLLAGEHPLAEPDANLLARSRQRLEEALDALPPRRWYERLSQSLGNNFARLQAAPVAAAFMLFLGGAAGALGGYYVSQSRVAHAGEAAQGQAGTQAMAQAASPDGAQISGISAIVHQPNSEEVQVRYNQIVPREISGSMDDPRIRQLLMLASENAASSGVGDGSVDLLAAECRTDRGCRASGVSDALIVVLRYGRSADMRRKALEGLAPYVAEDTSVRNAVLEALLSDPDTGIRSEAIQMLAPAEADTSVRQALLSVASSDTDPQVRLVSREALNHAPVIQ
jgi:hypothetical protein